MTRRGLAVWQAPVLLAVTTGAGLVGALLLDGLAGDALAVAALTAPVGISIVSLWRARRPARGAS